MDPPRDPSPALLPWEVIERIISHSCDSGFPHRIHLESIRNFSLTSRELYPRSLCFLVAEPTFSSRDKIFAFCDFLQGKPHLKPSVRSITVDPNNFAPVPLLRILPHLPEIEFLQVLGRVNSTPTLTHPPAILHQSWLTCCRQLTVHTRILCLSSFSFATPLQFFQVLSAFSNIAHLTIRSGVSIKTEAGQVATPYVTVAQQRLSQRLRLLTLVIDDGHPEHYGSTPGRKRPHDEHRRIFAGGLLLSSGLVQSTAECLTVDISPKHRQGKRPVGIAQKLDPFRLRSLTLKLRPNLSHRMTFDIEFLKEFQRLSLKEVTVEVHCAEPRAVLSIAISPATHADFHEQLENAMLGFPQPKLVWVLFLHPMGRTSVCQWVQAFGRRFPTLFQRGALAVVPNEDFRTGHTCCVGTVAISPDSKWVASGSRDGTVVLRNDDGVLVQQWVAHDGSPSLAFSSDSQYLVSGATNGGAVAIWDLHGLGGVPRILEGHTDFAGVASCVCSSSPKGDVIAAGSRPPSWAVRGHSGSKRRVHDGGIVQLWDAHTFQRLHTLEPAAAGTGGDIASIEFSPDGRWLLAGFLPSSYYIWDVVLGAGRQLRVPVGGESSDILVTVVSAAFDPGSTRLAIVSPTGSVEILDVTDEEERCHVVLGASGDLGGETRAVAFSPNGDWVLTVPNKSVRTHAMRIWDARTGTADAKFQKHWESWFNQDDVDALVSNGINTVRIPVGYWIVERLVDRKTEFYPRGGILQLQRGLGQLKAAGISVILDHHALPGVQTALSSFAGYCTPDAQFYTPANYQRALTWTAVMTALSHLDSNFGSVFSIEAINEPIMDANKAPGLGDFEKNFVQTVRVMESILGIDSASPVAGLPLNRTLPSKNFTTALTMVMSDSPDLHPQVRQAIRDSGPILMELSPSLGFGLPTGAPSAPLVMREPLVASFMEMGWQHNNPPNPADAADGPAAYDGHLYYSYGGVADANEESYMYHICNTPGRARYDAAIGNSPLFFGEWSLSTNFDASDAFMRRWADAQKFVFSQTRGWIYWNFKMESSLPGSELRQWDYMEGVRRGYLTKDPSKFNDPNVCARYARKA